MQYFVIFLVCVCGSVVAWSSSEVSCASCGSECQDACGTRNFRACCFNFQRRRRTEGANHGSLDSAASFALQDFLRQVLTSSQGLPQDHPQGQPRDAPYTPQIPWGVRRYLRDSVEEEDEEEEEGGKGLIGRPLLRHPLRLLYPQRPPARD